jgi:hypothetical protein
VEKRREKGRKGGREPALPHYSAAGKQALRTVHLVIDPDWIKMIYVHKSKRREEKGEKGD